MRWVIAGGGTGGHFFPALEVALRLRDEGDEVLFLGVPKGIEARLGPKYGLKLELLQVEGFRGRGLRGVLSLLKLPLAVAKAVRSVGKSDGVFVTGGYASFPVALAAFIAGKPLWVHEQNSVPGWTNLFASFFAHEVWVTFKSSAKFFMRKKVFHTGNILRKEFEHLKFAPPVLSTFRLLVLGGSSGARTINEVVVRSLNTLDAAGVEVHHQVGSIDMERVRQVYAGFKRHRLEEFIEDMVAAYRKCTFLVSRAGATTLSELSCVGRGALLVPYPYAVGDHQKLNALEVAKGKGAFVVDNSELTPELLCRLVLSVFYRKRLAFYMAKGMRGSVKVCSAKNCVERMKNELSV